MRKPAESGLYYLQSRYYDPEVGRFINADALISTGQGLLGNNMFAYCRNNPVCKKDAYGYADEDADEEAKTGLAALLDEYTTMNELGFSINIESATSEWDKYIKGMGVNEAYSYMSEYLCQKYKETYGKEFLFSDECVAYEIEYHVDAYMAVNGYNGYYRNITTYFMEEEYIEDHCGVIDIYSSDVYKPAQSVMFDYQNGIRSTYQRTADDPYSACITIFGYEIYIRID